MAIIVASARRVRVDVKSSRLSCRVLLCCHVIHCHSCPPYSRLAWALGYARVGVQMWIIIIIWIIVKHVLRSGQSPEAACHGRVSHKSGVREACCTAVVLPPRFLRDFLPDATPMCKKMKYSIVKPCLKRRFFPNAAPFQERVVLVGELRAAGRQCASRQSLMLMAGDFD
jgi:hypothetical protein